MHGRFRQRIGCGLLAPAVIILTISVSDAFAQTANQSPQQKLRINLAERFRIETWNNTDGLEKSSGNGSSCTRTRTDLTMQWSPSERFDATLKFCNEFRYYFVPENKPFNFDEIFVDQFFLRWKTAFDFRLTLTLGRQNFALGEGFIVLDGGPLDGSRSGYFNGARMDYDFDAYRKLTLFYFYQPRKDDFLPVINNRYRAMNELEEDILGAGFTSNKGRLNLQAYAIRKNTKGASLRPKESDVNTFGIRVVDSLTTTLAFSGEGAYQFGKSGAVDRSSAGGYAYAGYRTDWPWYLPQVLTVGSIYLSGDCSRTKTIENWEPLFGRWPKWSESYIYTLTKENTVAYWTNLLSVFGRAQYDFSKTVRLTLDFHHLRSPHKPNPDAPFPGGRGKTRGDLYIGKLVYQLSASTSGHIIYEYFDPGSYYFPSADDYGWFRIEFLYNLPLWP